MIFITQLNREIQRRKALLAALESRMRPERYRLSKINKKGYTEYYMTRIGTNTRKYVPASKLDKLDEIKFQRKLHTAYKLEKAELVKYENFAKSLHPLDWNDLENMLPESYRGSTKSLLFSESSDMPRFTQSENPYKKERLTQNTSFGLWVRSRVEAEICERLYQAGYIIEYEKRIELRAPDGTIKVRYPDFVIRKTWNGPCIIWEHLGRLDDDEYRKINLEKIGLYHDNGYDIFRNLIITCDKANGTMDLEAIANAVEFVQSVLR